MPYAINTARATIIDSNGNKHYIDAFSDQLDKTKTTAIDEFNDAVEDTIGSITSAKNEAISDIAEAKNTAISNFNTDIT